MSCFVYYWMSTSRIVEESVYWRAQGTSLSGIFISESKRQTKYKWRVQCPVVSSNDGICPLRPTFWSNSTSKIQRQLLLGHC